MKRLLSVLLPMVLLLIGCARLPEETVPIATEIQPLHSELYIDGVDVEESILWFSEVCLDAEIVNSGDASRLQKWDAPLLYRVRGTPTREDLDTLAAFAQWLNTVPGFPGIREAAPDFDASVDIFFCTQRQMADTLGDWSLSCDGGVTFWYDNDRIRSAAICIRTDLEQSLRSCVILEELYNSLGPIQDTDLREDSIIYSGFSQPQWLTQEDMLILKLLYHPSLEPGMDADQCAQVIRTLYY